MFLKKKVATLSVAIIYLIILVALRAMDPLPQDSPPWRGVSKKGRGNAHLRVWPLELTVLYHASKIRMLSHHVRRIVGIYIYVRVLA